MRGNEADKVRGGGKMAMVIVTQEDMLVRDCIQGQPLLWKRTSKGPV